ncbi:hypothetical protein TNCV_173021 [Trichonephila clavipes]|nr:hypothetical protein TNCV_173021 [Trichonephila clavipes]
MNINVTLFSYSRALGGGPRHFEPWCGQVTRAAPELAPLPLTTTPTGGRLSSRQISRATETSRNITARVNERDISGDIHYFLGGRGSRVVLVSDRGLSCHEFEPSTTKDPPCRAAYTLNLSRAEMSSRWCGMVVRRGGASSGVVHVT